MTRHLKLTIIPIISYNINNKSKGEIMKTNYVYIVKCQDNTFYTGWTTDLVKRINAHNHGKEMCIRDRSQQEHLKQNDSPVLGQQLDRPSHYN